MAEEKNEPEVQLNIDVPASLREKIYGHPYIKQGGKIKVFVRNIIEKFLARKK